MALMIQVSELSFYTAEGRLVLEDVHLRVERGEWLLILGPPESGKTVFLKLLLGEFRPRKGQILVNDRNVTRLSPEKALALRRSIGVIPQPPIPLGPRRVREYLLFKLRGLGLEPEEAERKVQDTLENLALERLADQPAEGLPRVEQALVQLALAVCNDPILLMADEPCAGLDPSGAVQVFEAIQRLHQRKRLTILTTTQDGELAERFGTRVLRLENGRFIAVERPRPGPEPKPKSKPKREPKKEGEEGEEKPKEAEEGAQQEAIGEHVEEGAGDANPSPEQE